MNYAERAKALLKDEFFLDVVKTQQELYIGNILNSSETDVDLRERSLIKHRAIAEALEDFLTTGVVDGRHQPARECKDS